MLEPERDGKGKKTSKVRRQARRLDLVQDDLL